MSEHFSMKALVSNKFGDTEENIKVKRAVKRATKNASRSNSKYEVRYINGEKHMILRKKI